MFADEDELQEQFMYAAVQAAAQGQQICIDNDGNFSLEELAYAEEMLKHVEATDFYGEERDGEEEEGEFEQQSDYYEEDNQASNDSEIFEYLRKTTKSSGGALLGLLYQGDTQIYDLYQNFVRKLRELREIVKPEMLFRLLIYFIKQEMKRVRQTLTNEMINMNILEKIRPDRRHSALPASQERQR